MENNEKNKLSRDTIIEIGQTLYNGNLLSLEEKNGLIEFVVEENEEEKKYIYNINQIIEIGKRNKVIKSKEIKLINKNNEIVEFETINHFYNYLLEETGKNKINKGLLYNLKNGKSKSCYGYKLFLEEINNIK